MPKPPDLDANGNPIVTKPPDLDASGNPITEGVSETEAPNPVGLTTEDKPKNLFHRSWDAISEPLTDAPTRWAQSISNWMTDPNQQIISPTGQGGIHDYLAGVAARLRGFEAGATEGAGNVLSTLTSPINLAATLATGGTGLAEKYGLGTVARGLDLTGKAMSIPVMAHGGTRIFDPDATWQDRAMGLAEIAGGATAFMKRPQAYAGAAVTEPKIGAKPNIAEKVGPTAPEIPPGKPPDIPPGVYDKFQKFRDVPVGTKYTVSPTEKLPLTLKDATALGFEFKGLDDNGRIMVEKVRESPQMKLPPSVSDRSLTGDLINLPRTLMASMDMSAPLRQGLGLIYKKQFWTALPDMMKAFGSKEFYDSAMSEIADRPLFRNRVDAYGNIKPSFAQEAGLKLTNLNNISQREESIMSSIVDKIPGLGSSERAYTLFLNKLRADVFQQMMEDGGVFAKDKTNMRMASEIANFVNNASGRGDLGRFEDSAKNLSSFFFSPRLMASRLRLLDPRTYINASPFVRRQYLKSMFSMAAFAGSFVGMAKLAGADVETDPASSDFMKVKIGNTRIDPWGGFQQYLTLAQRLMPEIDLSPVGIDLQFGGKMKSTTTGNEYDLSNPKFGQSSRADILMRFLRSKTNPIINFGWGLMAGMKEISGQPMDLTNPNPFNNSIAQRFLPMLTQDIYDLIMDETTNPLQKGLGAGAAWFGMGEQTYGDQFNTQ